MPMAAVMPKNRYCYWQGWHCFNKHCKIYDPFPNMGDWHTTRAYVPIKASECYGFKRVFNAKNAFCFVC